MTTFHRPTDNVDDVVASDINQLVDGVQQLPQAEGWAENYKIAVSVASNNLTVALKTLAGTDPTSTNPVSFINNSTIRTVTSALSVTLNAATNWFNAGGAELATKEIDYFVYLGYNATDGVTLGFARIPFANQYSDFSVTSTNEKYAGISNIAHAASTDYYNVIGRFAATLSAGAGYTWTIPSYTALNLIQRPIYRTRWLSYAPTITGYSANPTNGVYRYLVDLSNVYIEFSEGTPGTSNATTKTYTTPFTSKTLANMQWIISILPFDNGANRATGPALLSQNSNVINFYLSAAGAWTASGSATINTINMLYDI